MKRQLRHWTLGGWLWLNCSGCVHGLSVGEVSQAHPAPSAVAAASESDSLGVIERQVAVLVQRAMARNATTQVYQKRAATHSAKRLQTHAGADESLRQLASSRAVAPKPLASDRTETLRVHGLSGDFCAAISISSQLAVTALHCVQSLCESAQTPRGSALPGCRVNFELPNGAGGEATVVATSDNDLLALLDLHQPLSKHGVLRCDDPRTDDRVYTVSHPNGENWLLSYGWLTREPMALEWVDGQATRILVAQIPTKHGSSGGGLFDVQDRVVGVQIARWSPWSTDFGKAAFVQATRIFNLAGRYCMQHGSSACVGLRCTSKYYDVWSF